MQLYLLNYCLLFFWQFLKWDGEYKLNGGLTSSLFMSCEDCLFMVRDKI